ncbi:MAG: hypothetical protein FJY65_04070 [Calditrichaeota bacterium]|nr:hypothetical protein [Calditrichota bacterium]
MKLELSSKAAHHIKKLKSNPILCSRIRSALLEIAAHPFDGKSLEGVFRSLYSKRVGDWRIIYRIYREQLIVLIVDIADRKDV